MSHSPMTIVELVDRYPTLFYSQQWWRGEQFTRALPDDIPRMPPTHGTHVGKVPNAFVRLPRAVDLLNCYVRFPDDASWAGYYWTDDRDVNGQRVYIGGLSNGVGMEIHRHLNVDERWSIPRWA